MVYCQSIMQQYLSCIILPLYICLLYGNRLVKTTVFESCFAISVTIIFNLSGVICCLTDVTLVKIPPSWNFGDFGRAYIIAAT